VLAWWSTNFTYGKLKVGWFYRPDDVYFSGRITIFPHHLFPDSDLPTKQKDIFSPLNNHKLQLIKKMGIKKDQRLYRVIHVLTKNHSFPDAFHGKDCALEV